jgi:hypothetical protein
MMSGSLYASAWEASPRLESISNETMAVCLRRFRDDFRSHRRFRNSREPSFKISPIGEIH